MSLSRLAVLCALVATSTHFFAVDPASDAVTSRLHVNLESVRLVPWFTGIRAAHPQVETEPALTLRRATKPRIVDFFSGPTCLKLRTYRVKRQESFSEGESGSVGYSTCRWASTYELRSTVETETFDIEP